MTAHEITVRSEDRTQAIDVTEEVSAAIPANADGLCAVYVRHTTAGVVVQEAEPRLLGDIERALEELVPDEGWRHDEIDDNGDAHVRATILGEHVSVPVTDGALDLGTWQSVVFVECDGPRERTLQVVTH